MEDQLLQVILSNTFTRADFHHRLSLLRGFLEYLFFSPHKNLSLSQHQNEFFGRRKESEYHVKALSTWGTTFYRKFTKDNVYELLDGLSKSAKNLPDIKVYLPFKLPEYEIPRLGNWFRANVGPNILIDLRTDPSLIGGCALVWKGLYRDFSLRFYLDKNRKAVMKVILDYATR